ncbi:MAG: MarR family winged helix-turn-helix transcriptional regulator [Gemmatimonadales bacterium]
MDSVKSGSDIGSLRREIGQSVPFASSAVEALLTLQRTSDDLNGEATAFLKAHGITPTQYNALRIVRGSGPEGISTHDVGKRLVKRDPDVPRLLERLTAAGLVERHRCAEDRRVTRCLITPQGVELLDRLGPMLDELHARQFGMLSDAEQVQLVQLLDRVRARLAEPCAEARAREAAAE